VIKKVTARIPKKARNAHSGNAPGKPHQITIQSTGVLAGCRRHFRSPAWIQDAIPRKLVAITTLAPMHQTSMATDTTVPPALATTKGTVALGRAGAGGQWGTAPTTEGPAGVGGVPKELASPNGTSVPPEVTIQ